MREYLEQNCYRDNLYTLCRPVTYVALPKCYLKPNSNTCWPYTANIVLLDLQSEEGSDLTTEARKGGKERRFIRSVGMSTQNAQRK